MGHIFEAIELTKSLSYFISQNSMLGKSYPLKIAPVPFFNSDYEEKNCSLGLRLIYSPFTSSISKWNYFQCIVKKILKRSIFNTFQSQTGPIKNFQVSMFYIVVVLWHHSLFSGIGYKVHLVSLPCPNNKGTWEYNHSTRSF